MYTQAKEKINSYPFCHGFIKLEDGMEDEGQLHVGGHHRVLADLAYLSGQLMGVQEVQVAPGDGDSVADVLHLETLVCLHPDHGDRSLLLLGDVANLRMRGQF